MGLIKSYENGRTARLNVRRQVGERVAKPARLLARFTCLQMVQSCCLTGAYGSYGRARNSASRYSDLRWTARPRKSSRLSRSRSRAPSVCLAPLAVWVNWQTAAALWLGYGSHILADAATKTGVPGLRMSSRWYLLPKSWRILTGSPAEDALLPVLAASVIYLLLSNMAGVYK